MTIDDLGRLLLQEGKPVNTGHWQAVKGTPHSKSIELPNVIYQLGLPLGREALAEAVEPNLPWAEDHFQERVAGVPTNPGEQYVNWPWYDETWQAQGGDKRFSHTYQERFWPREAGNEQFCRAEENQGIRYRLGDLDDVLNLLAREPFTRQAYLPIWFPEDTGAHAYQRVPCSLGYHFLLRDGKLHINYFIRSCDYLRYMRDDVYMAGRLCQWVVNRLKDVEVTVMDDQSNEVPAFTKPWATVVPGMLTMFISSLHVFEGDLPKMRRLYG